MDWTAAAHRAHQHLGARTRTFSEERSRELIDFFADFVGTILGHVTTAVHDGGSVPKAGGW